MLEAAQGSKSPHDVRGFSAYALALSLMSQGAQGIFHAGGFLSVDGWGLALGASALVLWSTRPGSRLPAALLLFALGLALTAVNEAREESADDVGQRLEVTMNDEAAPVSVESVNQAEVIALPKTRH